MIRTTGTPTRTGRTIACSTASKPTSKGIRKRRLSASRSSPVTPTTEVEARGALSAKCIRLLVIAAVLAGILVVAGIMTRVERSWSSDADRKAAAVEQELRSAVQRIVVAVDAGTATFNQNDPRTAELLEPGAGSFVIDTDTGQLTANRQVSSGAADRCVTVRYDRTTGAIATQIGGGLCPPLLG